MRYAVIIGDTIANIIVWDGEAPFDPGEGAELLECPAGADIGYVLEGGQWVNPNPDVVLPE